MRVESISSDLMSISHLITWTLLCESSQRNSAVELNCSLTSYYNYRCYGFKESYRKKEKKGRNQVKENSKRGRIDKRCTARWISNPSIGRSCLFVSIDPRKSQCSGSNAPITTQSGAFTRGNNHLRPYSDAGHAPAPISLSALITIAIIDYLKTLQRRLLHYWH